MPGSASIQLIAEEDGEQKRVCSGGPWTERCACAGQPDLPSWFGSLDPNKSRVVLAHGEDGPRETLAGEIQRRFKLKSSLPRMNEVIEV